MSFFRNLRTLSKISNFNLIKRQISVRKPQSLIKLNVTSPNVTTLASIHTSQSNRFQDEVKINFIDRTGTKISVQAEVGDNLLDVAKDADIDGVEGACGGTLACSTCHCVFTEEDFHRLGLEDIEEDELDMLDLAFGLTDTSRLVCAIDVTEEMEDIVLMVPVATNDARNT